MTGFGSAHRTWADPTGGGDLRVEVEVRSVNARFLEVKLRQPFGSAAERKIRSRLEKRLARGRVELSAFVRRGPAETEVGVDPLQGYGLDPERVETALLAAASIEALAVRRNVELRPFTSLDLLRFLTSSGRAAADATPQEPPFLDALVDEAIAELVQFRRTEGEALTRVLVELADTLEGHVAALSSLLPGEHARLQQRWLERVTELCGRAAGTTELSVEPARVAQEVAILVARGDIAEELARIESHLTQLRATVSAAPAKGQGKTLDFVSQELLREVTTIGSKITSHEGSRIVIEAKSTIERIREQVANVE